MKPYVGTHPRRIGTQGEIYVGKLFETGTRVHISRETIGLDYERYNILELRTETPKKGGISKTRKVGKNGILRLPSEMLKQCGMNLGDHVKVIGNEDCYEIWRDEDWERYKAKVEPMLLSLFDRPDIPS